MEVFKELVKREPNLLSLPMEQLVPISFIGDAAVAAYRTIIGQLKRMDQLDEQNKKTLSDGQDAGKMQLLIQAAIGSKLIEERPDKAGTGLSPDERHEVAEQSRLTHQQRTTARTISKHPEIIEEVIKEAEENEDIPNKTAVLNKVKANREKELREKYQKETKAKKTNNTAQTTGEALIYLGKLREIVLLLPAKIPPEGWTDESFAEANAMVEIIRKRLEAWP